MHPRDISNLHFYNRRMSGNRSSSSSHSKNAPCGLFSTFFICYLGFGNSSMAISRACLHRKEIVADIQ